MPNTLKTPVEDCLRSTELVSQTSSAGHQFYARPQTEDLVVFEDVVDRNEYKLPRCFTSSDIIIDVGAHIGAFSYAAALRGAERIYAYEAHPLNHAIACKNLSPFGDRVTCSNLAVWRSDEPSLTLYNDMTVFAATGGISVLWNNEGVPVQSVSLDDVLFEASNGLRTPIRLLKLDCEGSEYPILFTSKHLDIVEEICGEYHEIQAERVPERAKVSGHSGPLGGLALKDFLQNEGWSVYLEPRGKADGLFRATRQNRETDDGSFAESSVNIEEIKSRIQQAVARRQAAGQTSFINASARLLELLSREPLLLPSEGSGGVGRIDQFRSQPEFTPNSDDSYHVTDLLKYHDREFVWNAYRALLKREPDTEGLSAFLEKLRSGRFNKIDVLARLRFSPEGKRNHVRVDGLTWPAMIRRLYRLPVIGYVIELAVGIARLPLLIRNQRQIESHLIAQQKLLADHFDQTNAELRESLELSGSRLTELRQSFALSLSRLAEEQKTIARAQHQQVAALFREQQNAMRNGSVPSSKGEGRDRRVALDELYASFENQFRGRPEDIKQGLETYLPLLKDAGITSDILDLGCGRGEWLELLRDEGMQARGVESNRAMIDNQSGQNLEIVPGDALAYLRGLPENSLRAVTAFHFVEHIGLAELIDLLDEINRALKPGGLLIVETPNPKNLVVGACNFYSDPTHHKPLFPETLEFILNHRGFVRTQLQYLHPVEGSPFEDGSEASQALNSWLFGARDFAIVAWKASP